MRIEEFTQLIVSRLNEMSAEKEIDPLVADAILLCLKRNVNFSQLWDGVGVLDATDKRIHKNIKRRWRKKNSFIKACFTAWKKILQSLGFPQVRFSTFIVIKGIREGTHTAKTLKQSVAETLMTIYEL